ncbi:MAG: M16 family metallopeptidase [Sphingobacteriaceae bacterium]
MKINFKYSIYVLAIAISFSGQALAQKQLSPKVKRTQAAIKAIPLDAQVKTGKLPNGFTYYIRKNTEPKNRATLYLANKVGSILENDDQQGLAHFMEHMSFNGTKNYPKNDLVNYLQKAGVRFGADLNAYTSFDETVYQLPIPTDDPEVFKNGLQIMRDWAQDATLDVEEINKERGVVLEEKRLGKGAAQRMQQQYLPMLFNNSRYAKRLPIGTEEVLKNFKPEVIKQFYADWYRPDLQALIVVGDMDVAQVESMIKAKFSDLKKPAKARLRTDYNIPLSGKNQFITVTDKEFPVTVAQIIVKHPEMVIRTDEDYRKSTIRSLMNRMMQARFSELTKQANPPFLQAAGGVSGFLAGLDAFNVSMVAKPGEFEKGFKAALTETERIKKYGFTQTELDRAKQAYLIQMESSLKEKDKTASDAFVNEYLRHFLKGEASPGIDYEFKLANAQVPEITLTQVNTLARQYITDTNRDIIVMGPEKDKATMPAEALINTWVASVAQSDIKPYVDQVSDKPLLAVKPKSATIIAENKIPELGVTELTFSNGVRAVLKPTDFKNDEINFSAYSPGGTSLYSDADYQSAVNAASIIGRSGVGEFNALQLPKLLNGKKVSVAPYISERSEGISGYASPKDLEIALQLNYLYFTQPRKDTEIFKGFITQQKGGLANRENDPNSVFTDTVAAVLGNYNFRRTGPSLAKVEQINLDRAFEIYKERFADAGDFTFVFVGSFDVDKIKPLLAQYLGGLPAIARKEEAKNLGIKSPEGKIYKTVYKGTEPKATVRLVFTGDYNYTPDNNNLLEALGEVLQIKLIERLREDEGGVYSPGAFFNYGKYPTGRYSFTIAFGCGPENVEKLIAASLDEINKIKKNGALAVDLEKFMAEERRSTEVQLKENSFWLSYLVGQYQNNEDQKMILSYLEALKKVTPEALKAAANQYLSGANYIRLVLEPEKK